MSDTQRSITKAIKSARAKSGMTTIQVAEAVGVTRAAYSRWENGHTLPTGQHLAALAELYEQPVDEFLAATAA